MLKLNQRARPEQVLACSGQFRALTLLFACVMIGCGGPKVVFPKPRAVTDEDEPLAAAANHAAAQQAAAKVAAQQATAPIQPSADTKPATRAQATAVAAQQAITAGATVSSVPEPAVARTDTTPRRPADFSAWTHADFRAAKAARDPQLAKAVSALSHPTGDADAGARLLIELLEHGPQPVVAPSDDEEATAPAPLIRGLPQAIVAALAANRSHTARNALKQILLGTLTTDLDDRTFTLAALSALVQQPGEESEAIAFAVLSAPEAIRPAGRGALTAESLQRECLALVRNTASAGLRARLSKHVANAATAPAHRALILPMLLEAKAENLRAQSELALAPALDAASRHAAQRQSIALARRSIDCLMRIADQAPGMDDDDAPRRNSHSLTRARLDEARNTLSQLLNPPFIERLAGRLAEDDVIDNDAELLALAACIPCDASRAAIRQCLWNNWTNGDALVRSPSLAPLVLRDPALVLALKSLPRDDAYSRPIKPAVNNPQQPRLAKERQAKQAWTFAVRALTRWNMQRFESAGRSTRATALTASSVRTLESVEDLNRLISTQNAKQPDDGKQNRSSPDTARPPLQAVPLELPKGAVIEVAYHLDWPMQMDLPAVAGVSPIVVHYARVRFSEQPMRAVSFFNRQMKGASEHAIENGRWLDCVHKPIEGRLRSVDVIITRSPQGDALATPNRTRVEDLVTEILWIETSDFLHEPSKAALTGAR